MAHGWNGSEKRGQGDGVVAVGAGAGLRLGLQIASREGGKSGDGGLRPVRGRSCRSGLATLRMFKKSRPYGGDWLVADG